MPMFANWIKMSPLLCFHFWLFSFVSAYRELTFSESQTEAIITKEAECQVSQVAEVGFSWIYYSFELRLYFIICKMIIWYSYIFHNTKAFLLIYAG